MFARGHSAILDPRAQLQNHIEPSEPSLSEDSAKLAPLKDLLLVSSYTVFIGSAMHATWVMCSALEALAHVGVGAIRIVHMWAGREGRRCSQRHTMGVPNDLSKRGMHQPWELNPTAPVVQMPTPVIGFWC